jgi:hypothetical protein
VAGTRFVNLDDLTTVYSSRGYLSTWRPLRSIFHPTQRLFIDNHFRVVCCDPRYSAVTWKLQHGIEVQSLALSPASKHLAIVANTSKGPRMVVLDVLANAVVAVKVASVHK